MSYTVLFEKEYNKIAKNKPTIGLLMMVKNEEARILVSLESVKKTVDAFIIYDTGSTDKTVEIIKDFCEKNQMNLYMIQGVFEDFSTSRNVSLEYADTKNLHYLLLLDCNDELRGGEHLKTFAREWYKKPNNGFLMCQQWWSGCLEKYFNMRFIKARCGWRYRGSVHEWLKDTTQPDNVKDARFPVVRMPDNMVLYQDRTMDNNKSGPRFARDKVLLLKDYEKNPKDSRTLFYLAQTCMCLNQKDEGLYYSKLRIEQPDFEEERFLSMVRCGDCCVDLKHSWYDAMAWYMKAYEHSRRIEPVLKIADHYRLTGQWYIAYMFAAEALQLAYPEHCILFVDRGMYEYYRWHVMSTIACKVGKLAEGKVASIKAIETSPNPQLKQLNEKIFQEFYANVEAKVVLGNKQNFVEEKVKELRQKFPNGNEKQLKKRAEAMWKKCNKK